VKHEEVSIFLQIKFESKHNKIVPAPPHALVGLLAFW
jgi:hypothetical protein